MSKFNRKSIYYTWVALAVALVAVAIVIVWDWSSSLTEQRIRGEQSTHQHIEYAQDRINEKCLALEPVALRDCIREEIESARDHDRANQDLYAQQQMALFTKIMGYTAIAGLVLGAGSIALIFATLREMGKTNRIMREEQRPWLIIQNPAPFKTLGGAYRSNPAKDIRIKVINRGRTPAQDSIATYVSFSRDTIKPADVGNWVETTFLEHFSLYDCESNTVFQDEVATIPVVPLPVGMRTIGSGSSWSIMIVCLYHWEGEVRQSWIMQDVKRPPENVLKHQKT